MSDLFVMRRANGDLFAEQMDGKLRIPVWNGKDAVARSKARNPELMVFLPVRLDRPLLKEVSSMIGEEGVTEFFLLSDDTPDAYLDDGEPIAFEEHFPDEEGMSEPAPARV